jgi:hypothetical protein
MISQWENALKDKATRIVKFPNFPKLVYLYQSEQYLLSIREIWLLTHTDTKGD